MSALTSTVRTLPTGRPLLRLSLKLDAVVTGANGAAYLAAAGPLSDLLGVPAGPLRGVGAFLIVFAGAVALLGAPPGPTALAVKAVIAINVLWAVDSVALAVLGGWSPTAVGTAWIVAQAGVVAGFAALQRHALKSQD